MTRNLEAVPPASPRATTALAPPVARNAASLIRSGAAFAMVAIILVLTMWPMPELAAQAALTPWYCLVCGASGGVDVLLNVLFFIPLGAALRWRGTSNRRALLTGIVLTCLVETVQALAIPGRDASLSDVLTNSTGTAIGIWLFNHGPMLRRPPRAWSIGLAGLYASFFLLVQAVGAWGIRPAPPSDPFWGLWAHSFGEPERFDGQILRVTADAHALHDGELEAESAALRKSLQARTFRVDVLAVSGPPTDHTVEIFALGNPAHGFVAELDQRGRTLLLRLRNRATLVRLKNPALRFADALPARAGDTLRIAAGVSPRALWGCVGDGPDRRCDALPLRSTLSWALVSPLSLTPAPAIAELLGVGWLVVLTLPLGYGGRRIGAGRVGTAAGLMVLLALGLGGVPLWLGVLGASGAQWAGAAVGTAGGWALATAAGSERPRSS